MPARRPLKCSTWLLGGSAALIVGLVTAAWIGDTVTNRQAAEEMTKNLRLIGIGKWIDNEQLTIDRAPFGSFSSDQRFGRLKISVSELPAFVDVIGQAGFRPTVGSAPSEFRASEDDLIHYQSGRPWLGWDFYVSPKLGAVYITSSYG